MDAIITLEAIVCNDFIRLNHTKAGVSVANLSVNYKNEKSGNVAKLNLRGWGPLAVALTKLNKNGEPLIRNGTMLSLKLSLDSEQKINRETSKHYYQLVFDIIEFRVVKDSVVTE